MKANQRAEQYYQRIIRNMSGEQRLRTASALNTWARELIASSILEKKPYLTKAQLEKLINQKFYSYERE